MTPPSIPKIVLYRGFPTPGAYAWSPFVTKLEARLRFGGLAYTTDAGSPTKSPRGKIPYLALFDDQESSTVTMLSDSDVISKTFVEKGFLEDVDSLRSPLQAVQDSALRALLEDKLYFYQVHERWIENYYTMRDQTFGFMPYPLRLLVGLLAHRNATSTLYGQGTGRFDVEEITSFRKHIWTSVNTLLSAIEDKPNDGSPFWVMGGKEPTEGDTTLFGFIASGLVCAAAPETMRTLRGFPTVIDYARRIHDQYFPDYQLWESMM